MRRGFTLIEIMIVVAILLVLVTIAIGGFGSCYDGALRNRCISNLRVIHAAREAYFFQNPSMSECLQLADLAVGGYFRGRTEASAVPVCPASGTYSYQFERSNLQTVPTCSKGEESGHVLKLYE